MDEPDILALHHQIKQCSQSLKTHEKTKRTLQDLVAGLEQWRIILTRAGALRQNLTNDPERLMRYEDEFVDRVVTHFSTHKIESFREYELLQRPLVEIEEQINSERRSRRETFDQQLSRYEELLALIASAERYLRDRCRFDDEDCDGSYLTLRQVFLEKLQNCCGSKITEWEELERELAFLGQEREQDVTELLNQFGSLKTELVSQTNHLPTAIEDLERLEARINELKSLFERGQGLRGELRKLQFHKDENLKDEERRLLDTIRPGESPITISQLRQRTPDNEGLWELLKALYKKGHLEITLHRRD